MILTSKTVEKIQAIADPKERGAQAAEAIAVATAVTAGLAPVIREAVRAMRAPRPEGLGMSYGDVAKVLGVGRTRVQQLEKDPAEERARKKGQKSAAEASE